MCPDTGMELPDRVEAREPLGEGERRFYIRGLKKLLAVNPDARNTDPVKEMIAQHNITDEELK